MGVYFGIVSEPHWPLVMASINFSKYIWTDILLDDGNTNYF